MSKLSPSPKGVSLAPQAMPILNMLMRVPDDWRLSKINEKIYAKIGIEEREFGSIEEAINWMREKT